MPLTRFIDLNHRVKQYLVGVKRFKLDQCRVSTKGQEVVIFNTQFNQININVHEIKTLCCVIKNNKRSVNTLLGKI